MEHLILVTAAPEHSAKTRAEFMACSGLASAMTQAERALIDIAPQITPRLRG